jgi:Peptidase M15
MITPQDYWMGRDDEYPLAMTPQIQANAYTTVALANALLAVFGQGRKVNSGWRPPAVNAATPNAAPMSKHMTGQAIDLADPEGDLDDWLMSAEGHDTMKQLGLWHEHPAATKGWAHLQTVPPRSGNRTFYP